MDIERRKKFIVNSLWIILWCAAVYFLFGYTVEYLFPFIAAFALSSALRPAAQFLTRKTKLNMRTSSLFLTVLSLASVGAIIVVVGNGTVSLVRAQVAKLPQFYASTVEPMLRDALDFIERHGDGIWGELSGQLLSYAGSAVSALSQRVLSYASGVAMAVPSFAVKLVFFAAATFYFTSDREVIAGFVRAQTGERIYEKLTAVKRAVGGIIVKYLRSYAIILAMTFAELTAAFLILRVRGAVPLALAIAVFDILPVVGTGTVLLPWAAVEAVGGRYGTAAGLILSYAVIFVVRNIAEPRIVGGQVGLHPLAALFSMFVGVTLFGVTGLFAVPITLALAVELNDAGIIHIFNTSARETEA